jgi:hypothetical protein
MMQVVFSHAATLSCLLRRLPSIPAHSPRVQQAHANLVSQAAQIQQMALRQAMLDALHKQGVF